MTVCATLISIIDSYNASQSRDEATSWLHTYDAHRDICRECKPYERSD